jgi:NADP-dependent 3-hydroxy acid dehydrogenase YdfG
MNNLQDKVVLIVGAGRGIGRRAAELFHERGAHLAIASRNEAELDELQYKLAHRQNGGARSGEVLAHAADATNSASVTNLVNATVERFGRVDVLLYAAGIGVLKPFAEITDDDFVRVMNTNTRGAFLTLKAVLPVMERQKGGHIIALPGILGRAPMAQASVYAASKYAVDRDAEIRRARIQARWCAYQPFTLGWRQLIILGHGDDARAARAYAHSGCGGASRALCRESRRRGRGRRNHFAARVAPDVKPARFRAKIV